MLAPAPMFAVYDENMLPQLLMNNKVISITESVPEQFQGSGNMLSASLLLPPYEVICQEIDGQLVAADNAYGAYLMTKEPDMFLTAIFTAMARGIPIYMYIGKEEREMRIIESLKKFITITFGIVVGDQNNHPSYNPMFDIQNLAKMYLYDMITKDEYLLLYPLEAHTDVNMLPKLITDYKYPYTGQHIPMIQDYINFFDGFKANIKKVNHPLILPLVQEGPSQC